MPQYRQERNCENVNRQIYPGVGAFDIPQISPVTCRVENWISFNYAKTTHDAEEHGVHFFIDDYQFMRVWTNADTYTSMLGRFRAVCTPDFSTYTDFPKALQIWNHYRKHWLGAYWQEHGITVIPTISWSDEESLNWCFDGEPKGGTVAISSVGTQMDGRSRGLFRMGYKAMLDALDPVNIVFYGTIPEDCETDREIIRVASYQDRLKALKQDTVE